MNRDDALKLVGQRVSAWTAMNGTYCGILVRVTDHRPWRGLVKVDGVLKVPAFEYGHRYRRGFRPGVADPSAVPQLLDAADRLMGWASSRIPSLPESEQKHVHEMLIRPLLRLVMQARGIAPGGEAGMGKQMNTATKPLPKPVKRRMWGIPCREHPVGYLLFETKEAADDTRNSEETVSEVNVTFATPRVTVTPIRAKRARKGKR